MGCYNKKKQSFRFCNLLQISLRPLSLLQKMRILFFQVGHYYLIN